MHVAITIGTNKHTWSWQELWTVSGVKSLDDVFQAWLKERDPNLASEMMQRRHKNYSRADSSTCLMQIASYVEMFLLELLPDVRTSYDTLVSTYQAEQNVTDFSTWATGVLKRQSEVDPAAYERVNDTIKASLQSTIPDEYVVADLWQSQPDLDIKTWLLGRQNQGQLPQWSSLRPVYRIDYQHLFSWHSGDVCVSEDRHVRQGFQWTDKPISPRFVQGQVNYCLHCHERQGDFCAIGFPVKKQDPSMGYRQNPLGELLLGCPLEEHISEMMKLRTEYKILAACVMIMVENPLCALTGQKICNDCMKSCVYQKQEPVDIPKVETQTVKDVLSLPWGAEILMLLMSWNPTRAQQYRPAQSQNKSVAVMGAGPSGIAMAYHLLMAGLRPVMFDGMRLQPLDDAPVNTPIKNFDDITQPLDQRQPRGFGGVAEYGITVRWDKNLLLIPRLFLSRWGVQVLGQVRFGGTITIDDVWRLGFRHLVLALGAGLPFALPIKNSLAPGMISANDFLMNLQLNGGALAQSSSFMPMKMPVLVIGAGLTAVDAATEARAYYPMMVKRFSRMWHKKEAQDGPAIWSGFSESESQIIKIWLHDARECEAIGQEAFMSKGQGVSIIYRQSIQNSPAYRTNHMELADAMREGVGFIEHMQPVGVNCDEHGWIASLSARDVRTGQVHQWPVGTVIVATGQQPNVAYGYEHPQQLKRQGAYYQLSDMQGTELDTDKHLKSEDLGFFASAENHGHRVSIIGDLHPLFHGSVVKAIASAKKAYPDVIKAVANLPEGSHKALFEPVLIKSHTEGQDAWVTVKAPLQAMNARPGQLYRLQPFANTIERICGKQTHVESVTGRLWSSDGEHLVIAVHGQSACMSVIEKMAPCERISLMGPTGVRMRIPDSPEVHWLISDQAGLLATMSLVRSYQQAGCKVVLLVKTDGDADIPEAYWQGIDRGALVFWHLNKHGLSEDIQVLQRSLDQDVLGRIERVIIQGRPAWLRLWSVLQGQTWQDLLKRCDKISGSVQGAAQCLLKGICARCLQWQINPETGERTKAVFACSWQDQPLELIDMNHLMQRDAVQQLTDKCQDILAVSHQAQQS